MLDQEKHFYLQGNQDFNSRQKLVFNELDRLSAEQPENRYSNDEFKKTNVAVVKNKKVLKQFLGQESIFKRPEVALKKCTNLKIPEFIKNPHKWKKYALGDDEISDHSNKIVAMSFLRSLRKRTTSEKPEEIENSVKPKFNKYIKEEGVDLVSKPDEKPTFINGKTVMPEYVVGQKIKKNIRKKDCPSHSNDSVKLDHLVDDELDEI